MKKYRILFFVSTLTAILDQWTKYRLCESLPLNYRIEVVKNFFNIVHIRNPGIAFGLLTRLGSRFETAMLVFLSCVSAFLILFIIFYAKRGSLFQRVCFALIIGGAIGNLIDRFRFGEVIDFIQVHWYAKFYWPAFNIADSAISVGVFLLVVYELFEIVKVKRDGRASLLGR